MRLIFSALPLLAVSAPAFAHFGHLGELAGHSHWIAAGAVVAAAVLAAALKGSKDEAEEVPSEGEEAADEGNAA